MSGVTAANIRIALADTLEMTLLGLVIKKLEHENCPMERNTERTKCLRKEYAKRILQLSVGRELIIIDKTGVNL